MSEFKSFPNIVEADKADIVELETKIGQFEKGQIDEEKFKLYRLTRGVYGQRQLGVQMFRIKVPYGRITPEQIKVVADLSDKYASSNLHLTTRQDIQLHYVKLADSPEVWKGLTNAGLTGREACGNTVRNLTASPTAGIDPLEPFDVTPYAHAVAYYFLRNPVCQEMGRKIKPCFSSSDKDTAFAYFSDFGFIPKVNEKGERGFKVLVGGGLGAVAIEAKTAYEFLPTDQIIPFMEAGLRVFDRYGERQKRQKARLKFLIKKIGIEKFIELIDEERAALPYKSFPIHAETKSLGEVDRNNPVAKPLPSFDLWRKTNVFEQKQKGLFGVYVRVPLGDIPSKDARPLADILAKYADEDIRITINQGLLLRHVQEQDLPALHAALVNLGYGKAGFDSLADVTACPGTDTCNLAVTNSTGLALAIEQMVEEQYPEMLEEQNFKIKISGCMNACGQHIAANIGFHGSSLKRDDLVIPAMQIVLGGGLDPNGKGWMAQKVIKIPTKRILSAIQQLLEDYDNNRASDEWYNNYVERQGKKYFYNVLKPFADLTDIKDNDFLDWGQDHQYKQEIGVGECAGVILDVIGSILKDSEEKLEKAHFELKEENYSAAIYYAYTAFVVAAKAALLDKDVQCNTQIKILEDFQDTFVNGGLWNQTDDFVNYVLRIRQQEPNQNFAASYVEDASDFLKDMLVIRQSQGDKIDEAVISSYYKA